MNTTLEDEGRKINLLNIYGPAQQKDKRQFFSKLFKKTRHMGLKLMVGDWNLTLAEEDTTGENKNHQYKKDVRQDLQRQNLIDIHKTMDQKGIKFTFRSNWGSRVRLDKAFVSKCMRNRVLDYKIKTNTISDHDSLQIDFGLDYKEEKWGKGEWKLNNGILEEEEFKRRVYAHLEMYKINKGNNFGETWDKFKEIIKKESIHYSIERKKEKIHFEKELMKVIDHIQGKIDNDINAEENQDLIDDLKNEARQYEEEREKGLRMRAKMTDIIYDERPTAYFYKKLRIKMRVNTLELFSTKTEN